MTRNLSSKIAVARNLRELLKVLKTEGPHDSAALAVRLGISPMAVRRHLYSLQDQKLVTYEEQPRPMGRPVKVWSLKPAADFFFPDAHSELATGLLERIRQIFGANGLDNVLGVISRQQANALGRCLRGKSSLGERLKSLAVLRSRQGYLTRIEELPGGVFLLVASHCPVRAAAAVCSALCDHELDAFRTVIGSEHRVERTECMTAGGKRCVYCIRGK
jgi:predicted ArsR family transcriptional regulator